MVQCRLTVLGKEEPQELSENIQKLEAYLYATDKTVEEDEKPKSPPKFTVELKVKITFQNTYHRLPTNTHARTTLISIMRR